MRNISPDDVHELPAGWQLVPNIAIFDSRNEKGFVNEELLSVTISKGIIKQSELVIKKILHTLINHPIHW